MKIETPTLDRLVCNKTRIELLEHEIDFARSQRKFRNLWQVYEGRMKQLCEKYEAESEKILALLDAIRVEEKGSEVGGAEFLIRHYYDGVPIEDVADEIGYNDSVMIKKSIIAKKKLEELAQQ